MANPNALLAEHLLARGLDHAIYAPVFAGRVDLEATARLHSDAFGELMDYMSLHVDQYAVVLPGSTDRWVPIDYIKFLYKEDKNFRYRLARFVKPLTGRHYRELPDEDAMDLAYGNIGNLFLSREMTMCLFLNEGRASWPSKSEKVSTQEATLVGDQDAIGHEEHLSEVAEASMALLLLQQGSQEHAEDMDTTLEGDAVLEALPEFDIEGLCPILIDGQEFLFLDDICKTIGFREDEALSALAQIAAVEAQPPSSAPATRTQLDLGPDPFMSELAVRSHDQIKSIEHTVASALIAIKSVEAEYAAVPESAFARPRRMELSADQDRGGSIQIDIPQLKEADDHGSTAFQMDAFAQRRGGQREPSTGRDSSLWHYLKHFNSEVICIVHMDYSEEAAAELAKCKALSVTLCDSPLMQNANRCILVSRQAAMLTFGGNYQGNILSTCALAMAEGVEDPARIVPRIGEDAPRSRERVEAIRAYLRGL